MDVLYSVPTLCFTKGTKNGQHRPLRPQLTGAQLFYYMRLFDRIGQQPTSLVPASIAVNLNYKCCFPVNAINTSLCVILTRLED